ncbi:MAG: ribonuclease III [Roseburia sp.]|nr:ribonuclease III [Ruminococcus sp.]MCM1155849.1 ribonuclease III [Roseburia sp.]MCM1242495.1 ribonuclease III [Roseburia sp.]
MQQRSLEELEERIGYHFKNKQLLKQAVTHSSFANEQKINRHEDYERLEFLGDAVLELVSSRFLFEENEQMTEGQLTRMRASIVCEVALAYCARLFGLEEFLLLGKGEEMTGGRTKDSIISDTMEAVIGAVYIDGGMKEAEDFVHRFILSDLEHKKLFYDAKTILQEHIQQEGAGTLHYELISETGPDHDKVFVVEVRIDDKKIGEGTGRTKKAAEQQAAYQALVSRRR